MKKTISLFMAGCIMCLVTIQTSCIGSFNATKGYWEWNSGLGKWPGAIVFFIIGGFVTAITFFIDIVVLNLIEFWTGSNPMAMNEGDMEQQVVVGKDGNSYEITATMNRFDIVQLSGDNAGETQAMVYNPIEKSWSHEKDCHVTKLAKFSNNGQFVSIYSPDGKMATIPTSITDKALVNKMVEEQFASQTCMN